MVHEGKALYKDCSPDPNQRILGHRNSIVHTWQLHNSRVTWQSPQMTKHECKMDMKKGLRQNLENQRGHAAVSGDFE